MEEMNRISDERARFQKALHLEGFPKKANPLLSVPPIKEVSVHGLWDGIVGHPVDVKIYLLIAAHPNTRHSVIDVADPSFVKADVQNVAKVSATTDQVADSSPIPSTMKEEIAESLRGGAENDEERQWPNISQELSRSSNQRTADRNLKDLSGDTLVESDAQAFLLQQRLQYLQDQLNGCEQGGLAITQKRRLYPSLRSEMSPAQINQRDWFPSPEECELLISGIQVFHPYPPQSHTTVSNPGLVPNDPCDSRTCSSSNRTFTVSSEQRKELLTSSAPQANDYTDQKASSGNVPSSLISNALTPSRSTRMDSPSPGKAAQHSRMGNKSIKRKPWQTPSQEDFSPRKRIVVRAQKPATPSPIKVRGAPASDSKARRGIKRSQSNRVRSRSLGDMGMRPGVHIDCGTPGKPSNFKRSTCTVGRANGRRIKPPTDSQLRAMKSSNDTPHIVLVRSLSPLSSTGESGQDGTSTSHKSSSSTAQPQLSPPCPTLPTPAVSDSSGMKIDESLYPVRQSTTPIASSRKASDKDGHHPSTNRTKHKHVVTSEPKADSSNSTPDTTDRPWLRRVIPSSRYFSPSPVTSRVAGKPVLINLDGILYVYFPPEVDSGTYRVEIDAKINLTGPDKGSWYHFSIPGLPQLETSQPGGHFSFWQGKGDRFEIDSSLLDYTINESSCLVSGVSHFAMSPLLSLRFRKLPHWASLERIGGLTEQSIDDNSSIEKRGNLPGCGGTFIPSLESLELPPREMTRYPSEEMKSFFEGMRYTSAEHGRKKTMKRDRKHMPELLKDTAPDSLTTPPSRRLFSQGSETDSRKLLQGPAVSPVGFRAPSNTASLEVVGTQLPDDKLSEWANQKIKLCPAYFGGLSTRDDPLELEDPTKLSWNFEIRIDRNIYGDLECQTSLEVANTTTPPLLTIDTHGWIPSFSTVNGRLATQCEWRETEDGDLALWKVPPGTKPGCQSVKVQLWWKEFASSFSKTEELRCSAREYILPTVLDKIMLNASLTCNMDNSLLVLNDDVGEREEITWRADSVIGCNSIVLPKMYPGYRLRLHVDEDVAELLPPADGEAEHGGETWERDSSPCCSRGRSPTTAVPEEQQQQQPFPPPPLPPRPGNKSVVLPKTPSSQDGSC
ncbi:MAG: hypothetical protein Q9191_006632, partial [Dirinaria sp. TL-2023a]